MSRRYWYKYVGASGGEATPGNYILLIPPDPISACPGGPILCAIYATGGSIPYAITTKLQNYILLAKSRKHCYPDGIGQMSYACVEGNL